MASLWLCCLLVGLISTTNHQSAAGVPETDFGLKLLANETGCEGDPHGDRLKGLCDHLGMSCCLYTESGVSEPDLWLAVIEGDANSIGILLPQLPLDCGVPLSLWFTINYVDLSVLGEFPWGARRPGEARLWSRANSVGRSSPLRGDWPILTIATARWDGSAGFWDCWLQGRPWSYSGGGSVTFSSDASQSAAAWRRLVSSLLASG